MTGFKKMDTRKPEMIKVKCECGYESETPKFIEAFISVRVCNNCMQKGKVKPIST